MALNIGFHCKHFFPAR